LRLADRLKAYRWVRGLSQKELAATLGIDESTVWHWEHAGTRPSKVNTVRIEELLGNRQQALPARCLS
jgi:transcriptional regulator with XRE-family HTH domain